MNNDFISRSALLEFAHNHVGGTVDCNDIARFPSVDVVPMDFHERCLELEVKKRIAAEKTAWQCIENYLPVRHGRWIMRGGYIRCSECDAKTLWKDAGGTSGFSHEYEQVRANYCPNCGAKMDAEVEGC